MPIKSELSLPIPQDATDASKKQKNVSIPADVWEEVDSTDNYELYMVNIGEVFRLTDERVEILGKHVEASRFVKALQSLSCDIPTDEEGIRVPINGSKTITQNLCSELGIGEYVRLVLEEPTSEKTKNSILSQKKQDREVKDDSVIGLKINDLDIVRRILASSNVQEYSAKLVIKGKEAENELVEANLPLVINFAKRRLSQGMDFLDMIQEGNIGLITAASKFNWWRGNKFGTYAMWWIRQSIDRAIANHAKTVQVPVEAQEDLKTIQRALLSLEDESKIDEVAIADATGIPIERIQYLLERQRLFDNMASMDAPLENDDSEYNNLGSILVDPDANTEQEAEQNILQDRLKESVVLAAVTTRQEYVVFRHWGLDGEGGRAFEEIGKELGRSREIPTRENKRVLEKLKKQNDPELREFWEDL